MLLGELASRIGTLCTEFKFETIIVKLHLLENLIFYCSKISSADNACAFYTCLQRRIFKWG